MPGPQDGGDPKWKTIDVPIEKFIGPPLSTEDFASAKRKIEAEDAKWHDPVWLKEYHHAVGEYIKAITIKRFGQEAWDRIVSGAVTNLVLRGRR